MADFPSAVYSPRTIENRPGVVYDANDTKTLYAEDLDNTNAEIVAIETALGANLANLGLNGWLPVATIPTLQASDNPVYTLRFGADMTAIIGLGNRIKLTQNGSVKYFIVVKVGAYTGGNTAIDVYGGSDYDMENTTTYPVTLPYFSIAKAPFGFPMNPAKWTESLTDTADRSQTSPTNNTWYNLGSLSLSVPIGAWNLSYKVTAEPHEAGSADHYGGVSLSTSASSITDNDFMVGWRAYDSYSWPAIFISKFIILTAKTSYYLLMRQQSNNVDDIHFRGEFGTTTIKAVCAYL